LTTLATTHVSEKHIIVAMQSVLRRVQSNVTELDWTDMV